MQCYSYILQLFKESYMVVRVHEGGMTLGNWMFKTVAASPMNSCVSKQPFTSSKEACSSFLKQHCSAQGLFSIGTAQYRDCSI